MEWFWNLVREFAAPALLVVAGLIVLVVVIAIMDGGKRRPGEKSPHDSSGVH